MTSASSKKVIFASYLPQPCSPSHSSVRASSHGTCRTAIVVERNGLDHISIQGYSPVPYRDKHQCWTLFQRAAKELLAVPSSVSVCIRFSDPPHSPISSLHTVLHVPAHVVNLTVSPLPTPSVPCSSASPATIGGDVTTFLQVRDERDPYCRYRDIYHNPQRTVVAGRHSNAPRGSGGFVRQKCDFAEMNKLLSQLAEVSLSLERTREECDMIARRCSKRTNERSRRKEINYHAGNEDEVDGLRARVKGGESAALEEASDRKVEELINLAESIVMEQQVKAAASSMLVQHSPVALPDCPSDVLVRPSFSEGGAYVMWNPISLGVDDTNCGHKVYGYLVYVDEQLWAESPGPISSQVELKGLKHNTEYHIQVCTQAEHCSSQLSHPFTYQHREPRSSTSCHISNREDDSQIKAARVESWLKSSQTSQELEAHEGSSNEIDSAHVRFAEGTDTEYAHSDAAVMSTPKQFLLHTGSERGSPVAEDTKSITSSHTSGIVTDFPNSPKLSPACACARCANSEVGHDVMGGCSHRHSQHLSRHHHGDHSNTLLLESPVRGEGEQCKQKGSTSVTSSTLCPSPIPSTTSYIADTVIDEPLDMKASNSELQLEPAVGKSLGVPPIKGPFARYGLSSPHKGPSQPQDVRVVKGRRGRIIISWTPVRRDLKGCSSGFYVLGYRVYVNGSLSQTVDGAMKFETSLKCPLSSIQPPYHRLLIHVRTRSITAESLPSTTAIYDLILQRMVESTGRTKPLDSVLSSVDTVSLCTKTSLLSHPTSKAYSCPPTTTNSRRYIETFV